MCINILQRQLQQLLIIGFVIRWVPLVEQELPTDQEHLRSPPILSGGRVTSSFVFCVVFCRLLFVLLSFLCPRDKESGGILIYPCPSVRPSVRPSVGSSCSTSGTHLITNPMISNCCSCHCPVYMAVRFTSNVREFDVARGKIFFICSNWNILLYFILDQGPS
jgi:hypothetical protein